MDRLKRISKASLSSRLVCLVGPAEGEGRKRPLENNQSHASSRDRDNPAPGDQTTRTVEGGGSIFQHIPN